ncbi:MFS transporter [Streptomyces hypolithicus]
MGLFFDTFENNLSGTISQVLQHDFAFDGTTLKLVLASAFVGQFVGSVVLGRVADRYGRRRAFLINLALYSVFSLLGAFSPNAGLIVTRFFAGIGIGAEQSLSDCYLADVLPAKKRGRYTAWAYTLALGVPVVGFAALWLVPRRWASTAALRPRRLRPVDTARLRRPVAGPAEPAGHRRMALALRPRRPRLRRPIESPRWLAAKGQKEEAERLVDEMEAGLRADVLAKSAAERPPAGAGERPAGRIGLQDMFGARLIPC